MRVEGDRFFKVSMALVRNSLINYPVVVLGQRAPSLGDVQVASGPAAGHDFAADGVNKAARLQVRGLTVPVCSDDERAVYGCLTLVLWMPHLGRQPAGSTNKRTPQANTHLRSSTQRRAPTLLLKTSLRSNTRQMHKHICKHIPYVSFFRKVPKYDIPL